MSRKKKPITIKPVVWAPLFIIVALVAFLVFNAKANLTIPDQDYNAPSAQQRDYTVLAVGDIACDPANPNFNNGQGKNGICVHQAVASALKKETSADALLLLGDIQYEKGELSAFEKSFIPAFKDIKTPIYAIPGNHEYNNPAKTADGYKQAFKEYFPNAKAVSEDGKTYYAFSLGNWRIIALDSDCEMVGGCGQGSAQYEWLQSELATHKTKCTIAMWHHPVFTSGKHKELESRNRAMPFWSLLQISSAELVLNGHDHNYEVFAHQNVDGTADERGLREIIFGTGGAELHPQSRPYASNHQSGMDNIHGYGKLKLGTRGYSWEYLGTDGNILDSGSDVCH